MQILGGEIVRNDLTKNARGGSELMAERLVASLPQDLLADFQIILSRPQPLDYSKHRIFWAHDLANDPQAQAVFMNNGWQEYHRMVFVSYWQRQQFIDRFKIPHSKTVVLRNAIEPILEDREEGGDKLRFIYHTTPHRGLNILVSVFDALCQNESLKNKIHLDVYSSFEVYGWKERDKPYDELFNFIKEHPNMTYHGAVTNNEIRKALLKSDFYLYPCTWPETGCLSLIEAMSAGVTCIHSDLAVLPETSANWTYMYGYHEDERVHAEVCYSITGQLIQQYMLNREAIAERTAMGREYVNAFYDLDVRARQWQALLESVRQEPRGHSPEANEPSFVYNA